jgi:hypothetical protein
MKRMFLTILLIGVSPSLAASAASGAFKESVSERAAIVLFGSGLPGLAGAGQSLLANRARR